MSVRLSLTAHPTLATWVDAGNSWLKDQLMGGYDMRVLRITNSAITGDKPDLFITGSIHAAEIDAFTSYFKAQRLYGVPGEAYYVGLKFLLSPLEFRNFLDAVGSPMVKAYFDVGNVMASGYPDQWIRILGDRIPHVRSYFSGQTSARYFQFTK